MLLVFAHPDDESFFVGGTVAKYAKDGWHITLIDATNGEKGTAGTFAGISEAELGARRQEEVKKAAYILGIEKVEFLNLPDGGLKQLTPGSVEDPLYAYMKSTLPDVVITHDTTGFTNHPDHIKVCYATTYAFQKYAAYLDQLQNPEFQKKGRGTLWRQADYMRAFGQTQSIEKEPKLYFACFPQSILTYFLKEKLMPEESFGKPIRGIPDKNVTTIIDIVDSQLTKGKALICHETQLANLDWFLSFANNPMVKHEYFLLRMQGIYEVFMGKIDRFATSL